MSSVNGPQMINISAEPWPIPDTTLISSPVWDASYPLELMFQKFPSIPLVYSGLNWTGRYFPEPVRAPWAGLKRTQHGWLDQLVSVKLNPAEWIGMTRWLNKRGTQQGTTHTHVSYF